MKYECPNCQKKSITYMNKVTMHGGIGTKCPDCKASLGTTKKWNLMLLSLLPLSIFTITPLIQQEQNTLAYIFAGLYASLVFVIYGFMPLIVEKKK